MLKASSKRINITPPIGLRMAGFEERNHGSIGIQDQLYANIMILDDSKTKIAMVTIDIIGVDKTFMNHVRQVVENKTDIKREAVFINATHTHSGPDVARQGDMGSINKTTNPSDIDLAYSTLLPDLVANGIVWANQDLQPARLGIGQGHLEGLGSNRIDANRYVDNTVTVIKVEQEDRTPLAIFTLYACHPTILNFNNYLYSGDYISYYRYAIEDAFEPAIAMFAQGAAGNISTRHTRKGQGFEEAKRMGTMLANEVIRVASSIDTSDDVELAAYVETLTLPAREYESDDVCEQKIKEAADKIERLKKENAPDNIQRTAYVEWQGVDRYYRFKKMVDFTEIVSEMQIIRIGDWSIVTTPAELFSEIAREIRALDASGKTVVTGYTNGYIGYVPDYATYRNPIGYEINTALVSEQSESIILEVAKKLMAK